MSFLTYGMIGDRLSDLVGQLRDFEEHSVPDIQRVILNLDLIRQECDLKATVLLIPREDVPLPGLGDSEYECVSCHKRKPDVRERNCGYQLDVWNREVKELICDECEQEHIWDI